MGGLGGRCRDVHVACMSQRRMSPRCLARVVVTRGRALQYWMWAVVVLAVAGWEVEAGISCG